MNTFKDEKDARPCKDGQSVHTLHREVIGKGLCTACGACIGVCPNKAITMEGVIPLPSGDCKACGACYNACPGKQINMGALDRHTFGRDRGPNERRIGIHRTCYATRAGEHEIRENGTSGGVITALLLYALENRAIDAALVTAMRTDDPLRPGPVWVTRRDGLIRSQKTKYMLVPGGLLSILRQGVLEHGFSKIAVVGSPCHIHAIRKMQSGSHPYLRDVIGARIKYTLGLHCAFNFFPEGTASILQVLGLDPDAVRTIDWRDTTEIPFPGQFSATTDNGEKRIMDLMQTYVILGGIYDHPRCRLCYDWANEVSDISSGDEVDASGFHKPGAKRSHTVVRTARGEKLFQAAGSKGYLQAEKVTEDDIASNVGFFIKKVGNVPRIEERRKLGLPLPDYGNYPCF